MQTLREQTSVTEVWEDDLPGSSAPGRTPVRSRIPMLPSRGIGWAVALSGIATAVLGIGWASAVGLRYAIARSVANAERPASAFDRVDVHLSWLPTAVVIAVLATAGLFVLWSFMATINSHRLAASRIDACALAAREVIAGLFLASAFVLPNRYTSNLNVAQLIAVGLAVIGLLALPAPFTRMSQVARRSMVIQRPFRSWRGMVSLAYIAVFGSQLLIHARGEVTDLRISLAPSSDPFVFAGLAQRVVLERLQADLVVMGAFALATLVLAYTLTVGVCSLDHRHGELSQAGATFQDVRRSY